MLNIDPRALPSAPLYRPILDAVSDVFVTPPELAQRWGYTENHLSNLRQARKGLPFVKLPTGGVRYRLSEILAAELRGTDGPVTLSRVEAAVASCAAVSKPDREKMLEHLRACFEGAG